MEDAYQAAIVAPTDTNPQPARRAVALLVLLAAAALGLSALLYSLGGRSDTPQLPSRYSNARVIASGSIAPSTGQQHANPDIVITDSIPMTLPESYLGVGSPLAVARSGDTNMRLQGYWLSLQSPGAPKENGDPFMAKWDFSANGCNGCFPIGGQFQPNHDTAGYDYALYMPDNTSGYLQIYDPGYQPKPGYTSNGQGIMNTHFDHNTPCGDPSIIYPTPCPAGQPDFNNPSTTWCANNTLDTGDNEIGYSQCDTQAMSATTVYTLYYPDSTPNYFGDDVPAATWVVPANHLPDSSHIHGEIDSTHMYSMTWVNFNNVPNPGYQIAPLNGNHQWRLNVNVPLDTDHNVQGVGAQNNYAIRVNTTYTGVMAYPLRRFPVLATVNAGSSDFSIVNIPASDAGKTMIISLFDLGDANGTNYIQLISPPTASMPYSHPVNIDYYVHDDRHNPPGPDLVYLNDSINATRPTYNYNDEWIDVVYHIPLASEYLGGVWSLRYIFTEQAVDHTVWEASVSDSTPYCTNPFVDISYNIFYTSIYYLSCHNVVSGTDSTHYSPSATATRAQFAKVVVKGFGLSLYTPATPSFTDVPPTFFAYRYIETGYDANILSGYTADQCLAANAQFPCYLPNRFITRAELTRLVVKAAGYTIFTPSAGPTFVDVPPSYFAYAYIETAYAHNVIHGVDATHFQPNRNIRRDEMAQIVLEGITTP